MKHKTWFRLVLKAIGIFLICTGLPTLIGMILQSIYNVYMGAAAWGMTGNTFFEMLNWNLSAFVSSTLQFALGCYLLFGGKLIVNMCIPSNRSYCPECGYDLERTGAANCPECGVRVRNVEAPPVADD